MDSRLNLIRPVGRGPASARLTIIFSYVVVGGDVAASLVRACVSQASPEGTGAPRPLRPGSSAAWPQAAALPQSRPDPFRAHVALCAVRAPCCRAFGRVPCPGGPSLVQPQLGAHVGPSYLPGLVGALSPGCPPGHEVPLRHPVPWWPGSSPGHGRTGAPPPYARSSSFTNQPSTRGPFLAPSAASAPVFPWPCLAAARPAHGGQAPVT